MKVLLKDIQQKFDALIREVESPEDVASFAALAMEAEDNETLELEKASSDKIWKAILYLSGVDLKDTPSSYLHCVKDFDDARKELDI